MSVFFIYVHDGVTLDMNEMECAPNREVVKRELASRVKTGLGVTRFVKDMEKISTGAIWDSRTEDEWPEATEDAHMAVWRVRGWEVPTREPDEIWTYSGTVDKPNIRQVRP
ncbi:hypothetical protein ACFY1P_08050 [Streptomyces sp. NPDC001407]|uniref:hypothetical protein n=1 Tax=Streptomyces sp. NPDC001407 TaxID=3364573 RepID=UPI0036AD26D2